MTGNVTGLVDACQEFIYTSLWISWHMPVHHYFSHIFERNKLTVFLKKIILDNLISIDNNILGTQRNVYILFKTLKEENIIDGYIISVYT